MLVIGIVNLLIYYVSDVQMDMVQLSTSHSAWTV